MTGHTGFKGTWLSLWLELLGADVVGVSLPPEPESLYARGGAAGRWPESLDDIRSGDGLHRAMIEHSPQLVFHLAAQPLVNASYRLPVETFETNVMGTVHVLEAVRNTPSVLGCVVVTTDKVYRPRHVAHRHVESDALGASDPYSASKAATEHVVDAWRGLLLRDKGTPLVAVRAGNVIGGGDFAADRHIPDLVRAFTRDEPCLIRNPEFTRPWQHVLDPLAGYLAVGARMLQRQEVPGAINFGPAREHTVAEVADMAAASWGPGASWLPFGQSEGLETPLLALDSHLAETELGWVPTWPTDVAVERTISWWRAVLDGAGALDLCRRDIQDYMSTGVS